MSNQGEFTSGGVTFVQALPTATAALHGQIYYLLTVDGSNAANEFYRVTAAGTSWDVLGAAGQVNIVAGSTLTNPASGKALIYENSENSNLLTLRASDGSDLLVNEIISADQTSVANLTSAFNPATATYAGKWAFVNASDATKGWYRCESSTWVAKLTVSGDRTALWDYAADNTTDWTKSINRIHDQVKNYSTWVGAVGTGLSVYTYDQNAFVSYSNFIYRKKTSGTVAVGSTNPATDTTNWEVYLPPLTKSDVGLGNVDNLQQIPLTYLDTDNTLAANSDSKVASQKAVKAYIASATNGLSHTTLIDTGTAGSHPETAISFTDNTFGNVSTLKHGYSPKLSGSGTDYLGGDGNYHSVPSSATPGYVVQGFTGQTSVTVTHNFGLYPVVQVIDASGSPVAILPLQITHNSTSSLTVTFTASQSGTIIATAGSPKITAVATVASSTYTLSVTDDIARVTYDGATITLPTAVGHQGKLYTIDNNSASSILLNTTSSEALEAGTTLLIPVDNSAQVYSTGAGWRLVTMASTGGGGGGGSWGSITGTLAAQLDLAAALTAKESAITPSGDATQFWNGTKSFSSVTKSNVGLSNVDNLQQVPMSYLSTSGTLSENSDTKVATQKAVKTYIDATVSGSIILQGDWNASSNSPNISGTSTTGYAWRVGTSGTTSLGGISSWSVGDMAVKTATGWLKVNGSSVAAIWGNITGTLSSQSDLVAALAAKFDTANISTDISSASDNSHVAGSLAAKAYADTKFGTAIAKSTGTGQGLLGFSAASTPAWLSYVATATTASYPASLNLLVSDGSATTGFKVQSVTVPAAVTLPALATGSDIQTGTDNAKMVTAQAVYDGITTTKITDTATDPALAYPTNKSAGGQVFHCTNSGAISFSLTAGFPAGFTFSVVRMNTGDITFASSGGTAQTLHSKSGNLKLKTQYAAATVYRTNTANEWMLVGDLEA